MAKIGKYWEDFNIGDKAITDGITITEAHLVNWAGLTMDFYSLHMDEEWAKKTPFGGRIAHGPLIFALAIGLAHTTDLYDDSIIAWLGIDDLRIPIPVRIGDTIKAEIEVKEKRETSSPARGITILRYTVKNQRDEVVMWFDCSQMMHRRR